MIWIIIGALIVIFSYCVLMRAGTIEDRIEEEELKERQRNGR